MKLKRVDPYVYWCGELRCLKSDPGIGCCLVRSSTEMPLPCTLVSCSDCPAYSNRCSTTHTAAPEPKRTVPGGIHRIATTKGADSATLAQLRAAEKPSLQRTVSQVRRRIEIRKSDGACVGMRVTCVLDGPVPASLSTPETAIYWQRGEQQCATEGTVPGAPPDAHESEDACDEYGKLGALPPGEQERAVEAAVRQKMKPGLQEWAGELLHEAAQQPDEQGGPLAKEVLAFLQGGAGGAGAARVAGSRVPVAGRGGVPLELPVPMPGSQAARERARGPSRLRDARVPGDTVLDVVTRVSRAHGNAMHLAREELCSPLPRTLLTVARLRPHRAVAGLVGVRGLPLSLRPGAEAEAGLEQEPMRGEDSEPRPGQGQGPASGSGEPASG